MYVRTGERKKKVLIEILRKITDKRRRGDTAEREKARNEWWIFIRSFSIESLCFEEKNETTRLVDYGAMKHLYTDCIWASIDRTDGAI